MSKINSESIHLDSNQLFTLINALPDYGDNSGLTKEKALNSKNIELAIKNIEKEGKKQFFDLQKNWSWYVGVALGAMILFQFIVLIFIGFVVLKGFTNFTDTTNIIIALSVENFAQIVGLALIVVKFLFPKE